MGHPKFERIGNDGLEFHLSEAGWPAPRLSKSLLGARIGGFDWFKTNLDKSGGKISLQKDFNAELSALLEHIQERLEKGLDEAWISPHGYAMDNITTLDEEGFGAFTFYFSPEERWARAFTELFVFSMYGGSGGAYGIEGDDLAIYSEFPRVFPLAVACQHLATYCVLSRGFALSKMQTFADKAKKKPWATGCSCTGGSLNYEVWERAEKFEPFSKYTTVKSFLALKPTPGSVLVFNPGGPTYNRQDKSSIGRPTHVGSVLRVSGARVQFIDTGVLIGNEDKSVGEGGTVDHGFMDSVDPLGAAPLERLRFPLLNPPQASAHR